MPLVSVSAWRIATLFSYLFLISEVVHCTVIGDLPSLRIGKVMQEA